MSPLPELAAPMPWTGGSRHRLKYVALAWADARRWRRGGLLDSCNGNGNNSTPSLALRIGMHESLVPR